MTRVSNLAQHQSLVQAMLQHQQAVQRASLQVATGKRGDSYDDYGLDAVRHVNLSHVLAREAAYADNAGRAAAQLETQDLYIGQLRDSTLSLRDAVLGALAAGEARGLNEAADAAFADLRSILNKDYAGSQLFGGGLSTGDAFLPTDLAGLVALPAAGDAFANGPVVSHVIVAEGRSVPASFGADTVGAPLAEALRALGALLPLSGPLTDAQTTALQAVLPLLDAAAAEANVVQAENGVRARQAAEAQSAATDRAASFEIALSEIENVNPAEAISRLQAEQNALNASYQVFARLNELSLLNFI